MMLKILVGIPVVLVLGFGYWLAIGYIGVKLEDLAYKNSKVLVAHFIISIIVTCVGAVIFLENSVVGGITCVLGASLLLCGFLAKA